MLLDLHVRDVPTTYGLRRRVEDRLGFALGRFGERVGRVGVLLDDCNGPRGGVDKRCRIVAAVRPVGRLVVEGRGESVAALVDSTADRIGQLARRLLRKRQTARRSRHSPLPIDSPISADGFDSARAANGGAP